MIVEGSDSSKKGILCTHAATELSSETVSGYTVMYTNN